MNIYTINLFVVTLGSLLAEVLPNKRYCESKRKKYNYFFLIIVIVSLVCVSGFRYYVGTDYAQYKEIFIYMSEGPIILDDGEVGFQILLRAIRKIGENPQLFFFITSVIINIGIIVFLKRNANSLTLSVFFYINTFIYYGTMNGLRQYMASIILLLGFKYLKNGNFVRYLFYIMVAYLFHTSALIMIPVYFIVRKDTFSLINKIVLILFLLAFIFYNEFLNIIFNVFGESRYSHYENILSDISNGANILRILVWILPILVILVYRKRAVELYGKDMNIILNLCIIGTMFMILAYRHVYFARFSMYFDVYYLLLLPRICTMFERKTNRVMTMGMMCAYYLYATLLLLRGECEVYPYNYNLELF